MDAIDTINLNKVGSLYRLPTRKKLYTSHRWMRRNTRTTCQKISGRPIRSRNYTESNQAPFFHVPFSLKLNIITVIIILICPN